MKSAVILLRRLLDIREHEMGRLLLMSSYLLLVIASYTTSKAVRDSLFVTKIGPAQLPYMYLLIAAVMGGVSYLYSRTVNRIGLYRLIRLTSLISISNLIIFWWMFREESTVWFYVLYVWVSIFGAITASQVWLLATHVFDAREARRVFAWIGVGGILGGILGGALTNVVALWFGTEALLLVCAALMGITLVLLERGAHTARLRNPQPEPHARDGQAESPQTTAKLLRQVRESRHLAMLVLLLSIAVVVEAFVDYEYKFIAKHSFGSRDQLTAFFGAITFYIGIISLVFQVVLTSRILKRFGVGSAILLLPAGLLIASLTLAAAPVLWAAALLQLIDGSFSYSIHRSGMELLYLPVPPATRNRVKGFIDMFVDRFGRAVGGGLLVLFTIAIPLSMRSISLIVAGLAAAWISVAVVTKREYLHSFRLALQKKTIQPEVLHAELLDNGTVETLRRALSSADEREVLYALDLLSNTHPDRWRRDIQTLIHHPSSRVRARTIAVLAEWNDASLGQDEFIRHPDYATARIAAASALSLQWSGSARACKCLDQLLRDPVPEVRQQAIRTAGQVRYEEAVPLLIDTLADKRLRRVAREALISYGVNIIPELVRRLNDERESLALRIRIPKVLACMNTTEAAEALQQQLQGHPEALTYRVLKALDRIHTNAPEISFSRELIIAAMSTERTEFDRLQAVARCLESNPIYDVDDRSRASAIYALLLRAVRERVNHRLERILRLLALLYPPGDIYSAYLRCISKTSVRATAIEFLDNLLDSDCKELVIPAIEEALDPDRAAGVEHLKFISRESAFQILREGSDYWLQTIADSLVSALHAEGETFDDDYRLSRINANR
jgi:ATP/ADP translocase/HEAT repeat protein